MMTTFETNVVGPLLLTQSLLPLLTAAGIWRITYSTYWIPVIVGTYLLISIKDLCYSLYRVILLDPCPHSRLTDTDSTLIWTKSPGCSVADPGCFSWIWTYKDEKKIEIFSSLTVFPCFGSITKNQVFLTQKLVTRPSEICGGFRIWKTRTPDPGVRKSTGSRIRVRNIDW